VELRRRGDELVDPVDRSGRLRSDRVLLVAATPPARDAEGLGLSDADWRFVVGADRRGWSSVTARFKGAAAQGALALAEAGVVELLVPTGASRANVAARPADLCLSMICCNCSCKATPVEQAPSAAVKRSRDMLRIANLIW